MNTMQTNSPAQLEVSPSLRIFGVGDTGIGVVELLIADGLPAASCVAMNSGAEALERSSAAQKVHLETKRLRGLGSGGDPERARQAAEEKNEQLKSLCDAADVVFIVTGLGGGSGSGISPVLAKAAKSAGALVLAFVTTPFDCEGSRRISLADQGLEELRDIADGIVCQPNQKIFKLIEENTSVLGTFKISNRLLADCVQGVWRLLTLKGLIEIHLDDVCRLLQDRHSESAFAVAEASGPERSRIVIDKLFAHPMLESGDALSESEAVLVSLSGGPNLTMAEVNYVMEQVKGRCGTAQVMMGAGVDERFEDRLVVTLITAHAVERDPGSRSHGPEELDTQLLERGETAKPNSRFLPPAPALPPDQVRKLLSKQANGRSGSRKASAKLRQTQLPLEIVSKGRFDKSEPTIHKGEDLDVPTYLRRGVPLN
jgi:cell division protein FtsZ